MKSTQLRIGNWYNEFGIPKQATPEIISNLYAIEQNGKTAIDFDFLPLTEEWLKKLGFVYDDMSDTDDDNTWYHLDIGTVKFHSDKSCNFESVYCGVNMTKLEFKNVHKFQNFVFDLTGKELEFKL